LNPGLWKQRVVQDLLVVVEGSEDGG
jgi:hypothetical protein